MLFLHHEVRPVGRAHYSPPKRLEEGRATALRLPWLLVLLSTTVHAQARTGRAHKDTPAAGAPAAQGAQCPGGTAQGCQEAALEASRRGEAARAAQLNAQGCDAGAAGACTALGEALLHGQGLARDDAGAAQRLQQGCERGDARGCATLGTLVWQGRGVKADPKRAYKLYLRACDGGEAAGCFSAAICHRTGTCARKSEPRAAKLLERACDAGDVRACSAQGTR
jgi:TPR repeat protein